MAEGGSMYRVLVVDDEKYIRKSIINRIDWAGCGCEVAGEAADGTEGLKLTGLYRPQILITDIRMPEMDGLQLAQHLASDYPQVYVIIISAYNDFEYARKAMHYGVREYLLKPVNKEEMEAALLRMGKEIKQRKTDLQREDAGPQIPAFSGITKRPDVMEEICTYVQGHFMEDLSVALLAGMYHLNAAYLSTVFKEKNGVSLTSYIESVRLEQAKKYLKEDWLNITEAALAAGYSDSNYFTKVFRKYTGMTPSQWKKNTGYGSPREQ